MNALDFAIIIFVGLIVGCGFFLGIGRVTAGIISIYFASVVSATFYRSIATSLRGIVEEMTPATAELIAFVFLFIGLGTLFFILVSHSIRFAREEGRFEIADRLGGAGLGMVVAAIATALAVTITTLMLGVLNQTTGGAGGGILGMMREQSEGSALVPVFLRILPVLTSTIRPWFPGGLPPILTSPQG
jgi:uncharacterized membrane protein required for colicin V production